ncbi:MAG: DUF3782 domain-containing protein [Planctomycetaceae bacterium]|jgi:hypothetical protein|nr:DUF3782 domain-containing protein [Planctomycetaceae bacterium]
MSTSNIPDSTGLTFEKVWQLSQETFQMIKETNQRHDQVTEETKQILKEIARQIKKVTRQQKENSEQMKKTDAQVKETSEQMKKTDAQVKAVSEQMKKTDAQVKAVSEQMKKTDAQVKAVSEQMKQTDAQVKATSEQMKQTDRQIKKMNKQYGDLGDRFGELAEYLVAPGIKRVFNELGYHFYEIGRNIEIKDENDKVLTEIDLLLDNDETMIVIEVKSKPRERDIPHHTRRLEILREHIIKHKRPDKKIIGAIAGAIFDDKTKEEAVAAGFYTITQSGDTIKLDVPPDFQPRIF